MSILQEINDALPGSKFREKYVSALCIFHDDKHPSLMIYPDTYKCLSCGVWGKTSDLLNQLNSHSITPRPQPQTRRNPFTGWLRKESELSNILKTAYQALKNFPQQGKYLYQRGLTEEIISKLKIGYSEGFYIIPIISQDGIPVGALARAGSSITGARYFVPNGQDPNLLFSPDWQQVREAKEVYLTFGVFDCIAIHQCGKAAMSTTAGKRLNPSALDEFRKKIIVFPDDQEFVDAKRLVSRLGWRGRTLNFSYPYGLKDPANLFEAGLLQGILA